MQHDQDELRNVSRNVIRDMREGDSVERKSALIERACRHYAEMMEQETDENQRPATLPVLNVEQAE